MQPEEVSTPEEAIKQLVERGALVNLTPHPIRFLASWYCWIGDPTEAPDPYVQEHTNAMTAAGSEERGAMQWVTVEPSGEPYRLAEADEPGDWTDLNFGPVILDWMPETQTGVVAGVVTRKLKAGKLPPRAEGVTYIVSLPALMGLKAAGQSRKDIIAPDTGPTCERDKKGQIIGVRGFVRLA